MSEVRTVEKTDELDNIVFSHDELVKLTRQAINSIIDSDPLLRGLPSDPTIDEIKSQAAVAQGQAITIFLNRENLPRLSIVVAPHTTTVLDLKRAIRRNTELALPREGIKKKISWKHVWKKYNLAFDDVVLLDNNENIKNYGVSNKIELKYVKKRKEKNRNFHPRQTLGKKDF